MKEKFIIPKSIWDTVKELILNTDSMEDEERQYFFDIWNSMNESQQKRLEEILQIEKDKLDSLLKKYQDEISKLDQELLNEVKDLNKEQIYNLTFN